MASAPLDGPRGTLLRGCSTAIGADFLGFLERARVRYGSAFRIRIAPGWHGFGLLSAEHYEHVLVRLGDKYVKETREAVMLRKMLGRSVLTDNGPRQRQSRRLAQPALNSSSVQASRSAVDDVVNRSLDSLSASFGDGTPFDLQHEMMVITITLASSVLLGVEDTAQARGLSASFWRSNLFLSQRMTRPLGPLAVSIPSPANRQYRLDMRRLDAVADTIIDVARRSKAGGGRLIDHLIEGGVEHGDPARLRSEVKTFLFSGHETSSTTLTWFWYFVSRDEELRRRFIDEVDQEIDDAVPVTDQVDRLDLTNRIVQEVLRFYPPGYIIGRQATVDDDELGFRIPKGSQVYLSPFVTHRDPEYWERPTEFDPDRFTAEASAGRPRFAYVPFGAGARRCLGDRFASLELATIVAMMGRRFRVRLLSDDRIEPEPLLTIRPSGGLPVRIEPRAA
jgi:cytochrome P450